MGLGFYRFPFIRKSNKFIKGRMELVKDYMGYISYIVYFNKKQFFKFFVQIQKQKQNKCKHKNLKFNF